MATIEHTQQQAQKVRPDNETTAQSPSTDLRIVPIKMVSIREGFNPRTTRDEEKFGRTAFSVREHGVLAPVLVTPTGPDANTFYVVAGEGRFRSAQDAGQPTIPVLVCQVDERTNGLELTMAENMAREDLDPVAMARGFDRLRKANWSKRQIAEELSVTQKLVAERLRILQVSEDLHPLIANGEIPLSAVRSLAQISQIHVDLPAVLVARVRDGKPVQTWEERLDWPAAVDDPIAALTADYHGQGCNLPPGVYSADSLHVVADLPLTDETRDALRELAGLHADDHDQMQVRLTREGVEQARALRAAYPSQHGFAHLIVGEDVLVQVIADQSRAELTRRRKQIATMKPRHEPESEADPNDVSTEPSPEEVVAQRARERKERQDRQRAARAHNTDLGVAVVRSLARVKLDLPLLRVLLAVQPLDDLSGLAARGARYCLPGWPAEETTKTGKLRVQYLEPAEAGKRAHAFVEGAATVGETCGRLLSLIVLARYADEDAIAQSRRARYGLPHGQNLPWNEDVIDTLDTLCADRLPDHITQPVRERYRAAREAGERAERERRVAQERVEQASDRLDQLTAEERDDLIADATLAFGRYSSQVWDLRQKFRHFDQVAEQADEQVIDAEQTDQDAGQAEAS